MFNFFKKATTDEILYKELGKEVYIRNGVGFSNISDNFLYDNYFFYRTMDRFRIRKGNMQGKCRLFHGINRLVENAGKGVY